jgi:uncharacterized protein (DUF885 family)
MRAALCFAKDYLNWLERLKEGMKKDVVLPKVLTLKLMPQIQAFLNISLEENLFYQPVLRFPENFKNDVKDRLKMQYVEMSTNKITPKHQGLHQFLESDYLPVCRYTDGVSALPYLCTGNV